MNPFLNPRDGVRKAPYLPDAASLSPALWEA